MTILALDTTSEFGSIVLRRDGATLGEAQMHSQEGFSHIVFEQIARVLGQAGVAIEEIDCFAAASGPGSFTGVRVGLTAVKGLAEMTGKPVAPVSNLRALAAWGETERRAVLLDARRGEVYAAVYDANLRPIVPESVGKLGAWLQSLAAGEYEFITLTGSPFVEASRDTPFSAMRWVEAPRFLASAVALCAERDAATNSLLSPLEADANYVRSSDAELFWRDH